MRWKLALRPSRLLLCLMMIAAVPASSLAEQRSPGGITLEAQRRCQKKNDACIHYCLQSGKAGKELNSCTEGCTRNLSRCYKGLPPA